MLILFLASSVLAGQPTRRAVDFDRGGNLYAQNCWMCHGKLAEGGGPAAAKFSTESPALAGVFKRSSEQAIRIILDGKGDMPAFSQIFDKREAKRILVWLEKPAPVKKKTKSKTKKKTTKKKQKPQGG
jgi:mono/diheme cytochrome c family protein